MNSSVARLGKSLEGARLAVTRFFGVVGEPLLNARIGDDIGKRGAPEIVKRTHELCRIIPDLPHAHVVTTLDEYCGPPLYYAN